MVKVGEQLENLDICDVCARDGSRDSVYITPTATAEESPLSIATKSSSAFITAQIESSKRHWSQLLESDTELTDEEVATDNRKVFETLQMRPKWGRFFSTFGYDTEMFLRVGELEVGEKIAEGGQAEIFNAKIKWQNVEAANADLRMGTKWVLKVFKKGTLLRNLYLQMPEGFLQLWAYIGESEIPQRKFSCDVFRATLLSDGRFAFLMVKEDGDLRSKIDQIMSKRGHRFPPFPKEDAEKTMYSIALGVNLLHKQNIVHRDIKASNVLIDEGACFIADFECSVGVVGTGFWRAPEILQACKDRTINQRQELFTKASDVYSYGMTCYEVLTGMLPFEGDDVTIDMVIKGRRPQLPKFVDDWTHDLLNLCWHFDTTKRPSIEQILSLLGANSSSTWIERQESIRMKVDDAEDSGPALLGCTTLSHTLAYMECATTEGGGYFCKLCLTIGDGEGYHCTSCVGFDLHPECARVKRELMSFMHLHELWISYPYNFPPKDVCNGCLEELEGSKWVYSCPTKGCNFNLHARCAKYAETISHPSHQEHKLVLLSNLTSTQLHDSMIICEGCNFTVLSKQLVYQCEECGFNIHPSCALGEGVGS